MRHRRPVRLEQRARFYHTQAYADARKVMAYMAYEQKAEDKRAPLLMSPAGPFHQYFAAITMMFLLHRQKRRR